MATFDFPASPTVGQKYPTPSVMGVPTYTWDGFKWTTFGGTTGTIDASDEVPLPDATPGVSGVSLSYSRGDHVHPNLHVAKTGDTMTGDLLLAKQEPYLTFFTPPGSTTQGGGVFVESALIPGGGGPLFDIGLGSGDITGVGNTGGDLYIDTYSDTSTSLGTAFMLRRGTGLITVKDDPTEALGIATKQYVDLKLGQTISLAGGKSFDIAVPAQAKAAKLYIYIYLTTANPVNILLQLSLQAGVFKTTSGDYSYSGFSHSSGTPSTVSTVVGSASSVGMVMAAGHQNVAHATVASGLLIVKRPSLSNRFTLVSNGFSIPATGYVHQFYENQVIDIAHPSMRVLAIRIMSASGDNWSDDSYANVEWI